MTQSPNEARWTRAAKLAPAALLLLGAVVYLPALRSPFLFDDYLHASMVDGTFPAPRSPFDLYDFVADTDRAALLAQGILPWWSDPRLVIRFFRPLSSALLWADHRLLGNHPFLLHLHSFAWWAAALLAVRALFKLSLPPRVALMATIIFALAPAHTLPLGWLANREALISLTFGTLALTELLRSREDGGLGHAAAATGLFGLALLGGEYAFCFAGYVLALELSARGRSLARRALGLATFGLPAAIYLSVRTALRYGTVGSGFYQDPFGEPLAFLQKTPHRLASLLLEGWLAMDSETLRNVPRWLIFACALVAVAVVVVPLRRTYAALDARERALATWMFLGSLLAMTPVLAVVPSPRLLGASLLGIAACVALVLDRAWFPVRGGPPLDEDGPPPPRSRAAELTGLVALALGFAHFVHGPVTSWLTGREFRASSGEFAARARELGARLPELASTELGVVRGSVGGFFLPFALDQRGVLPARWRILSETRHVLVLRRGPRTLELVAPKDRGLFSLSRGDLFRSESSRLAVGDEFDLPGMRVTVLENGDDGPRSARFEFDRDIDAPPFAWIAEEHDGFPLVELPKVGFGKPFDP